MLRPNPTGPDADTCPIGCIILPVASIQTLERRIAALEARLADIEGGYGETIYRLQREVVRTGMDVRKILNHLSVSPTSDEEIDSALDEH